MEHAKSCVCFAFRRATGMMPDVQASSLRFAFRRPIAASASRPESVHYRCTKERMKRTSGLTSVVLVLLCVTILPMSAQTVTATLGAGTGPQAVALNPVTNKVYVLNGDKTLTVIDGATNNTASVAVGTASQSVAVNPVTNKIYVTNGADNTVTVVDGSNNSTTTVGTGLGPQAIAINAKTNKIYVTNGNNTVTVIDGGTNTTSSIPVGLGAAGIAVNVATNVIYVANSVANTVSVINGSTNTVAATVPVGTLPNAVGVNPVTNNIYVANSASNTVSVINGASNTVTATVAVGTLPVAVAINPVTNRVYVSDVISNSVTVIDGSTNTAAATVATGTGPHDLVVNSITNQIYVADFNSNDVTIIDGGTNSVISLPPGTNPIPVGTNPVGVAVNPVTNRIYVANHGSNNVTAIDGEKTCLASFIGLICPQVEHFPTGGLTPAAIGVNPITSRLYVVNRDSNNVGVITSAGALLTTIPIANNPAFEAIAVDPISNRAYVVNSSDNSISAIDGVSNIAVTVPVGTYPSAVAVNPVRNKAYVTNLVGNTVTVIDGATNATVTIPTAARPFTLAVNPVTNKIYVGHDSLTNDLTIIDGNTNSVLMNASIGGESLAMAIDPVHNKIYVSNNECAVGILFPISTVSVIDGTTDAISTLSTACPAFIGTNPITNKAYVAGNIGGLAGLYVIDGATNAITPLPSATASIVNPATNRIYGSTIVDGITNSFNSLVVAGPAGPPALNPVSNDLFFAMSSPSTVLAPPPNLVDISNSIVAVRDHNGPSVPLTAAITPAANNAVTTANPAFAFTAASSFSPTAPAPGALYYQLDTMQGAWTKAASLGGGSFSASLGTLVQGLHVLYAYATDGQDATISSSVGSGSNPLISNIAGYEFVAVTPVAPTISKSFRPATAVIASSTALQFTITNPNAIALTGIAFSDSFPAGLKVATPNGVTGSCGAGVVTATAGSTSLSLAGGTIGPFASCTFSVNVTSSVLGTLQNTTGAVTSTEGGTGTVSNTATLTVVSPVPTITKAFGAPRTTVGGTTSLTFTLANPNTALTLTGVAFNDALPAGLVVATPNGLTGSCGGTVTAVAGSGAISLTSATLAALASCSFSVNVMATTSGVKNNTTGVISANETGPGATSNTATLTVDSPPTISIAFGAPSVPVGGTTSLTFTIGNSGALLGLGLVDTLPAGLVVATPNAAHFSGCGEPFIFYSAVPGSNSISYNANLPSGTCLFTVNVTGTIAGTKGDTATIVWGGIFSTSATSNTAILTVEPAPPPVEVDVSGSGIYGAAQLTAVVSVARPAVPTGTVTFREGTTVLGSATPKFGVATISLTGLGAGDHMVVAAYSGDANYPATNSDATDVYIPPALLTIRADNFVRAVNAPNPTFTGTISGSVNGDAITASYSTAATQSSPPGAYPILAFANGSASVLANYAVATRFGTLTIVGTAAQSGWWVDPKLNGEGYFVETGGKSGKGLFIGAFAFDALGSATWAVSTGPLKGNTYSQSWLTCSGGQMLTGLYQPATCASAGSGAAGADDAQAEALASANFAIVFNDPTHAVMTRPDGSTIALSRLSFTDVAGAPPQVGTSQVGWWWADPAAPGAGAQFGPGTGYGIEFQGASVFIAAFVYGADGKPVWYLATGALTTPTSYSGAWDLYAGGPQLNSPEGNYAAQKVAGKSVPMSLTFSDATHGTLTMGNVTIPITRFQEF